MSISICIVVVVGFVCMTIILVKAMNIFERAVRESSDNSAGIWRTATRMISSYLELHRFAFEELKKFWTAKGEDVPEHECNKRWGWLINASAILIGLDLIPFVSLVSFVMAVRGADHWYEPILALVCVLSVSAGFLALAVYAQKRSEEIFSLPAARSDERDEG